MKTISNEKKQYKIMGLPISGFLILLTITIIGVYLNKLPKGMIGALLFMMVIGALLNEVGNNTPIVKSFLGGGPIVIIFVSAACVTYGIFPKAVTENVSTFMKAGGFLNFYIAALIAGSILGMSRKLLIKAAIRYLPAIICGVLVSLALVGIVGELIGFGAKKAIFYIGIPIMGGGMGAGAVPLSKIFGEALNTNPTSMLSVMIPAVALGNALAIILGGLLSKLGKIKPSLSGNGNLMKNSNKSCLKEKEEVNEITLKSLGTGLAISLCFYTLGSIINKFIPVIHTYAWMIIMVAVCKIIGVLPRKYELSSKQWFSFVMTNLTCALLVGIGIAYTDLNQVIQAFNFQYLLLVSMVIIGSALGSGFGGFLVGFYPIESAITAGLCMANMGGTGDVAVLSASDRMELMPFAQISSRIGGAFMLILASTLLRFLA
ncbi:2-hydroxycarboxylate transporter family protein [Clostridium oceanicum]|uniref:2-hydroxycarboxylate transporter family protein n=1 Tax=Clostridium oceanicum TaxID=1543 RepID=A0ABP3UKL7_9CLOT